jgi:Flp pilus assembly protein TadG
MVTQAIPRRGSRFLRSFHLETMNRKHTATFGPMRCRGDSGAALVEFALAGPILISLLLGMVTSALALNDDMQVTHAAREGARYAATVPVDEVFSSGTWADNMQAHTIERYGEVSGATVCVALVTGSPATVLSSDFTTNGDGSPCYDDGTSTEDARVQVTITTSATIETGFASYDVDITSEATAKHESND